MSKEKQANGERKTANKIVLIVVFPIEMRFVAQEIGKYHVRLNKTLQIYWVLRIREL